MNQENKIRRFPVSGQALSRGVFPTPTPGVHLQSRNRPFCERGDNPFPSLVLLHERDQPSEASRWSLVCFSCVASGSDGVIQAFSGGLLAGEDVVSTSVATSRQEGSPVIVGGLDWHSSP